MRILPALTLVAIITPAAIAEVPNTPQTAQAVPGTLNYVEGAASLSGQALTPRSVGFAVLAANGQLSTATGKVEILLTPGVFLRLGENSILRMVSPDLTHTEVALEQGSAEVEVDQLFPQNDLVVDQGSTQTHLQKPGLYEFTANPESIRVLDGKAGALLPSGKNVEVKQGHLLNDSGNSTHTSKFDRDDYSDSLTDWSDLRADYLGQANQSLAGEYADNTMAGYSSGWDWDPAFSGYTWLPGNGLFYSPFGYGFFSPLAFGGFGYPYGAFYGSGLGYYGGGFYGGGGIYGGAFNHPIRGGYNGTFSNTGPRPGTSTTGAFRAGNYGGFHQGSAGEGGFHGGAPSMGGGGFHGGSAGGGGHR